MKKYLLSVFAIVCMLFATSCTHDEILSQSTGDEVAVTFTTELRNDVKSRAVGDNAHQIDQVEFAVYGVNGHLSQLDQTVTPVQGKNELHQDPDKMYATINVVLVKGQTYNFVFWAQKKNETNGYESPYTFISSNATVSINYKKANDKNADAFFARVNNFTVNGTFEKTVTLTRPFAQVNFLTTKYDLDKANDAGFILSQSSIVVENVATSLNLLNGKADGTSKATFQAAPRITDETVNIKNENGYIVCDDKGDFGTSDTEPTPGTFHYLATAYFLPTESSTITATMSVEGNTDKTIDLTVAGVNAQRNYRTNIYGNLLTSNGQFNIVVNPDSDGNHNVSSEEFTAIYTSLEGTLDANKSKTDALTYNIQTSDNSGLSNVKIEIPEGTKAKSLTFNLKDLANDATIAISNKGNGNYQSPVVVEVPEDAALSNITVDLPGAHVTLKQGAYTKVISSTSKTTLVISETTEVGTLEVKQGNVRIEDGAEVSSDNIKRVDNTDDVTFVIYEGDLPAEANTDSKIVYVSAAEFDLFNAATYGGEVKLTSNVELTNPLIVTNTMTIDLNGFIISQTKACTEHYEMIKNEGVLTIKGEGKISFKDTGAGDSTFGWGSYTIGNYGTLVVENGTVENLSEQNPEEGNVVHMYCAIQQGGGTTTINGGVISTPTYRSLRVNVGTVTINGGQMDGQVWMHPFAEGTGITISGGEFKPNGVDGSSVYIENSSKDVALQVTGGVFKTKIGCADATKLAGSITGGVFYNKTNEGLLAEGYIFQDNSDGTFTVIQDASYDAGIVSVTPDNLATTNFNQGGTFKLVGDFSSVTEIAITPTEGVETTIDASEATFGEQIIFKIPGRADDANEVVRSNGHKGKYILSNFNLTTLSVEVYGTTLAVTNSTLESLDLWGGNTALEIKDNTIDGKDVGHKRYDDGTNEYGVYIAMMNYDLKFDGNTVTNTKSHVVGINGLTETFNKDNEMSDAYNRILSFTRNTLSEISKSKDNRAGLKIWCDITYAPVSASSLDALLQAGQDLIKTISDDATNKFIKATSTTNKAYKFNFYDYSHGEL